ncbi:PilZ domain-containing protein [Bacillus sp. FJAT-45350]|uniref:PilZ domain-containing protein n=1 Tax=Bacillus sp. FJAT-45350 TaxID=2011014 RepID=UPI000BB98D9C|nr:PilZ domain-containing protein [Bacillus sp. FJAT-45350]
MSSSIRSELNGEICILTYDNKVIVGEVTKIQSKQFAIKIISPKDLPKLEIEKQVELQIDLLNENEVYFYEAKTQSIHTFNDEKYLFLSPTKEIIEENRRKSKRVKLGAYLKNSVAMDIRVFPPIGQQWQKTKVIDISEGGVQIALKSYFSKGQLLEVVVDSPFLKTRELILSRVVHTQTEKDLYHYSIQFLNISDKQRDSLNNYVEQANDRIQKK